MCVYPVTVLAHGLIREGLIYPAPLISRVAVHGLGLEEDRGRAEDEGILEECLGVVKRRQFVQRQVRDSDEVLLDALAVGWPVAAVATDRAPHYQVHRLSL